MPERDGGTTRADHEHSGVQCDDGADPVGREMRRPLVDRDAEIQVRGVLRCRGKTTGKPLFERSGVLLRVSSSQGLSRAEAEPMSTHTTVPMAPSEGARRARYLAWDTYRKAWVARLCHIKRQKCEHFLLQLHFRARPQGRSVTTRAAGVHRWLQGPIHGSRAQNPSPTRPTRCSKEMGGLLQMKLAL